VVVSGKVTLDGQPLAHGQILLKDPEQKPPREYIGAIEQGAFRCDAPPGSLRVEIRCYEQASLEAEARQIIPAKYNDSSELTAELKLGEPPQLSFELNSR